MTIRNASLGFLFCWALSAPLAAQSFLPGVTYDAAWPAEAQYDAVEPVHFRDRHYQDCAVLTGDEVLLMYRPQLYEAYYSLGTGYTAMTSMPLGSGSDGLDGVVVVDDQGLALLHWGASGNSFFTRTFLAGTGWSGVTRLWCVPAAGGVRIFGFDPVAKQLLTLDVGDGPSAPGPTIPCPSLPTDLVSVEYDLDDQEREIAILFPTALVILEWDGVTPVVSFPAAAGDQLCVAPRTAGPGDRLIWATNVMGPPKLVGWNVAFTSQALTLSSPVLEMVAGDFDGSGAADVLLTQSRTPDALVVFTDPTTDEFYLPLERLVQTHELEEALPPQAVAALDFDGDEDLDFLFLHGSSQGRFWASPTIMEEDYRCTLVSLEDVAYNVEGTNVSLSLSLTPPTNLVADVYRIRHQIQYAPNGPMQPVPEHDFVTSLANPLPDSILLDYDLGGLGDEVNWISVTGYQLDATGAVENVLPTRHLVLGRSVAASNFAEAVTAAYSAGQISGDPGNGVGTNNGTRIGGSGGSGGPPP